MADRDSAKTAPIDVQAVAGDVIDDWAEQFVRFANTPITQQVETPRPPAEPLVKAAASPNARRPDLLRMVGGWRIQAGEAGDQHHHVEDTGYLLENDERFGAARGRCQISIA